MLEVLWTCAAVKRYVRSKLGLIVTPQTIRHYLDDWGITVNAPDIQPRNELLKRAMP
jgi:hypothetical protein